MMGWSLVVSRIPRTWAICFLPCRSFILEFWNSCAMTDKMLGRLYLNVVYCRSLLLRNDIHSPSTCTSIYIKSRAIVWIFIFKIVQLFTSLLPSPHSTSTQTLHLPLRLSSSSVPWQIASRLLCSQCAFEDRGGYHNQDMSLPIWGGSRLRRISKPLFLYVIFCRKFGFLTFFEKSQLRSKFLWALFFSLMLWRRLSWSSRLR
jgi:hypothetical protein